MVGLGKLLLGLFDDFVERLSFACLVELVLNDVVERLLLDDVRASADVLEIGLIGVAFLLHFFDSADLFRSYSLKKFKPSESVEDCPRGSPVNMMQLPLNVAV